MPAINYRKRGFFTFAQNTDSVDYLRLAYGLGLSLRLTQEIPFLTVGVTPGTIVPYNYRKIFDNVIEIPWRDDAENSTWKLENEWKAIWMSPYEETIKLDTDMLFFHDIGSWWDWLDSQDRSTIWTNTILDWKGGIVTDDYYRKVFTKNRLPNIYTGFGYFKKTKESYDFFNLAKHIFWNWQSFFESAFHVDYRPTFPSTDVIYALAEKLLDIDQTSYIQKEYPTFTHMKSHIQGWNDPNISEDWRVHVTPFFTSNAECKIGNHKQVYPLHYHIKEFLTDDIIKIYERNLNV